MPYKEKEIEKLYFTIGEVAKMFDVNTSHIRFWSKQFDVIKPATNKKGNRLYTQSDIDNFKKIYHLVKEKGFTLKGAKIELKTEKQKQPKLLDAMKPLDTVHHAHIPVQEPELFPLPVENDFVEKIAVLNSLQKIRKSLLDMQKELMALEPH
jgi:DNA-binding transcriptional MerR regulator